MADDEPLVIDVRFADGEMVHGDDDLVVVVEPTYGCVAIAAALDAGWESVEVDQLDAVGTAPIPLVSFEQPPPRDGTATRCRVRSDDLARTFDRLLANAGESVVLAAPTNARPATSSIARAAAQLRRIVFVPAIHDDGSAREPLTSDGFWAVGMLIRVLLEELDDPRAFQLTDAAGLAVSIATGAEDAATQLSSGVRWRDHLAAGGHADDLRVASSIDSIGAVAIVVRSEDGADIARPWSPVPVSSAPDA